MQLAQVCGTVVSTRKDPQMMNIPFLVLRVMNTERKPTGDYVVASDPIGVDRGEIVLFSKGSSARQTEITRDRPNDAVILGVVDTWEVGGTVKYDKSTDD